jgi:hypothetical protein
MTDDDPTTPSRPQTPVAMRYEVEWGGERMAFHEVAGLDALGAAAGTLLLRRGVAPRASRLWAWFDEVQRNAIEPAPLTIRLAPAGPDVQPGTSWRVTDARPVRISGIDLRSSQVAVEAIEFAHAGLGAHAQPAQA